MKKKTIRYSAFLIAAVLAIGSFSVWAMNTQATAEAGVDIGEAPAGLNVDSENPGNIIDTGILGRPGSLEEINLFTIQQPHENTYDGEYEVTVYVANAGELQSEFRYLTIDLVAENADGDTADVGYVTLENGMVTFSIDHSDVQENSEDGGEDMMISVDGGSYQFFGDNNDEPDVEFLVDISEGATGDLVDFTE